jgi:hypothetical protein
MHLFRMINGFDVVRRHDGAHELLNQIGSFVRAVRSANGGNRLATFVAPNGSQLLSDARQRIIPEDSTNSPVRF